MDLAIDEIVQNAHDFHPRALVTADLRPAIDALFRELEEKKVDYLLVGGVALLSYVDGRNTQDIDLIVRPGDVGALDWNATIQDRDFGRATYHGVRVDLLLRDNPLFEHVAMHERATAEFHGRTISVASREGLLLLKLYALPSLYRTASLARAALYEVDIRMLLQAAKVNVESLLSVLRAHLSSSDVDELARVVKELEDQERRRF